MPALHGNGSGIFDSLFGSGFDGVVTLSGDTILLRDMHYDTLTVRKGVRLFPNGFKIRCRQTCTIEGDQFDLAFIVNNGANARNSNGSAAEVSSSVPAPTIGGAAGTLGGGGVGGQGMYNGGFTFGQTQHDAGGTAGTQQVPAVSGPTSPFYFLGGAGGRGGDARITVTGSLFTYAGATGSSGTVQINYGGRHDFFNAISAGTFGNPQGATGSFTVFAGGAGGGAGACGNSGSVGVRPRSGWGGGGGGMVYIAARDLIFLGKVQARGGNGGNSFSFAAAGGGGGGGFAMFIYSSILLRNSMADQVDVGGGLPGTGYVVAGTNPPAAGSPGSFQTFRLR